MRSTNPKALWSTPTPTVFCDLNSAWHFEHGNSKNSTPPYSDAFKHPDLDKRAVLNLETKEPMWDYVLLEKQLADQGGSQAALNQKIIDDATDPSKLSDSMLIRTSRDAGQEDEALLAAAKDMDTDEARAFVAQMEKRLACFRKGAWVHTPDGGMAIDKLKVGDLVLSKSEGGEGPIEPKRVVNTFKFERKHIWKLDYVEIPVNQDLGKLTKLKIKQLSMKGKLMGCFATPNHPFYVKGEGWIALDQLKYGDLIPTSDPRVQVMVLQVTPVLLTTSSRRIAAHKTVINVLEADKRGETIDDVDLYDLYECFEDGHMEFFNQQEYRDGFVLDGEHFELTDTVYHDTVYNIEVEDHHTYFVWGNEKDAFLWVHNTNCPVDSADLAPQALQTRSGNSIPVGLDGQPLEVYLNKAQVYEGMKLNEGNKADMNGVAIVKRRIGKDTGANGKILASVKFDRGAPNSLFDAAVDNNEQYEYVLAGLHPDYFIKDAAGNVIGIDNRVYNYVRFEGATRFDFNNGRGEVLAMVDLGSSLSFAGLEKTNNQSKGFTGGARHAYINNLYNQLSRLKAEGNSGIDIAHSFKTQDDLGRFKRFIEDAIADESFKLFEVKEQYESSVDIARGQVTLRWLGMRLVAERTDSAERLQFLRDMIFGVTSEAGDLITPPRCHEVFETANARQIN